MLKIFKNWKVIFIMSLLLAAGLLYFFLLHNETKVPSKGWSNEIFVDEINNSRISESTRLRVTTVPIPNENRFIILWDERKSIDFVSVSKNGVIGKIKKINIALDEPTEFKGILNGNSIDLYSLESGKLKKYKFDYKTEKITFVNIVADNVNTFKLIKGNIILAGEKYIGYINKNEKIKYLMNYGSEDIDSFQDNSGIYKAAFFKNNLLGMIDIIYMEYNPQNGKLKTSKLGEISYSVDGLNDNGIAIGHDNNRVYVIVTKQSVTTAAVLQNLLNKSKGCVKAPKTIISNTIMYYFDKNDINNVNSNYLSDISSDNPNLVMIDNSSNSMSFIGADKELKGNNTEMTNLRLYTLKDGIVEPQGFLTKTIYISQNPNWFKIGEDEYLQWVDITGVSTKIMFASSNKDIIKSGLKLKSKVAIGTLLDTLMALGFGLSYMLLMFSCVILPTFLFIAIGSFLFLNWFEVHNKIIVNISIVLHVIAEFILIFYLRINKPFVFSLMPSFLQSTFGIFTITIIISLITIYCTRLKYKNIKLDKSFMNQYAFFGTLNMIIFSLVFFPYFYL